MKSDQELIKDFQKGNNHAFNTLVEKHLYNTIGFFIKITGNQSEAEDLAQDVFIKMYKALKKFKFGAKFKTYLYRSNVNMANSYFRSKKWKNILHLDQVADNGYEDETIEKEWKKEELWNAVSKLPSRQRKVLTLRIVEELRYSEISIIMKMSENSAKVNYHHAVKTIKEKLG